MIELEKRARELALAHGHKNPDEEIVCMGGRREAVWRFYRDDQLMRDQAAGIARQLNARGFAAQ